MRVLFVSPEIFPLAKTGGLGDVAGALPVALQRAGAQIHLLMPAYPGTQEQSKAKQIANLGDPFGLGDVTILEGAMPDSGLPLWLVDNPSLFNRQGGPYQNLSGDDWLDNDLRFATLGWAAARLASPTTPLSWKADILHAHDWQSGLAAAYLRAWGGALPGTVFTIHNMAYQGLFPASLMPRLGLPWSLYTMEGCEYWGQMSYLKAGLVFSDRLTTVSPTYAKEIQTPSFGFGFEGILASRAASLSGILNGAHYEIWDPTVDRLLEQPFGLKDMVAGKARNKASLQAQLGLKIAPESPLMVVISRLSDQKGMDLLLAALPLALAQGAQLALLGTGDHRLEDAFLTLADAHPQQVAVTIGYSEPLAHRLQAGGDILVMPSRFEPCGLSQLYAMRYGTLPIGHRTGGLADTIIDASYDNMLKDAANGFLFDRPTAGALQWAIERALGLFRRPTQWQKLQHHAMTLDYGWKPAALSYLDLYRTLRPEPGAAGTEKAKPSRKATRNKELACPN